MVEQLTPGVVDQVLALLHSQWLGIVGSQDLHHVGVNLKITKTISINQIFSLLSCLVDAVSCTNHNLFFIQLDIAIQPGDSNEHCMLNGLSTLNDRSFKRTWGHFCPFTVNLVYVRPMDQVISVLLMWGEILGT